MPVKRVLNSAEAASGEAGRRWLNRSRTGPLDGGMRRTSLPGWVSAE